MRASFRHLLLSLVAVCLTSAIAAQTGTSFTLQGTVTDSTGAVLTNAKVTVRNISLGITRVVQTDANGHYLVAALDPTGTYEIKVERDGFAPQTKTGMTFLANTSPAVNFELRPGSVSEQVTITEEAPLVATTKSDVDHIMDERKVSELPVNGRNFFSYVALAPGAVAVGGGSGNLTLNGQGRRQLTILADGVTNQNREIRTLSGDLAGANGSFSLDVVKEVQVVTNNFSAEFGRTPSAVVNVITKSGTNDFHGSAFGYFRPGAWDAKNSLTGRVPNFNRQQWGGTLGGPIIRDKTHFFGSYEQERQTQDAAGITSRLEPRATLLKQPFKAFNLFGKVDHQLTANNRLDFRYNIQRSRADNLGVGGLNTSDRAFTQIDNVQNFMVAAISVLSPTTVNEARFNWSKDVIDICAENAGGCTLHPDFTSVPSPAINRAGVGNLGPNPALPQNLRETGLQWQDKLSHTVGRHNLKLGGDVQAYFRFVTFFDNFVGTYVFPAPTSTNPNPGPSSYSQRFGNSGINFREALFGVYAQDDFRVTPRLTLNLGVRWDYETLMRDSNNFAPRVGFAWNPSGDGKTVVRGAFGLFVATIESSLINRESNFGPDGAVPIFLTPADPCFPVFPARFTSLPSCGRAIKNDVFIPITRGLDPKVFTHSVGDKFGGLRVNPYTQQIDFGIQRSLGEHMVISLDYNHVHGLKLLRTRDLNAPPFFEIGPGRTRTLAQADAQRPFGVPSIVPGPLGIDFGGYRRLFLQDSGDSSFYDALKVAFAKRMSHHFTVEANYTWSKAISDSDNFREGDSLHVDPTNMKFDRGLADQDRRHNFALYGLLDLPMGFRFGSVFRAISSFPYTGRVGSDANGDGDGGARDRPGLLGRNTFSGFRNVNLDANLSKRFRVREGHTLEGRFEVFNLLNHRNVTSVNNVIGLNAAAPPASFGTPTAIGPNRQFQLAVRYDF